MNSNYFPVKTTELTKCRAILLMLALLCALSTYGQTTDPFVTTWVTIVADETITIPTTGDGYNYSVTWEEGGTPETGKMGNATHTYATAGTHTVTITGTFPRIYFNDRFNTNANANKIRTIERWGNIEWTSMANAFRGCSYLKSMATDVPDLSGVTDMSYMFTFASIFNGNLSGWNVSKVTDMSYMFAIASIFNQDISNWDVSSVTNMANMFSNATAFNGDISNWDVSKVTNMRNMFQRATAFDGNLGNWDVSGVTNFTSFLSSAELSSENYDALLVGWNALTLQNGVTFDAGSSQYTSTGATAARATIINDDMWVITDGGLLVSFAENKMDMVTDIDGDAMAGMYDLVTPTTGNSNDDDNALFSIGPAGALSFKNSPDFENPKDANRNNIYAAEVTVTEGTDVTKVTVSVSVTNVMETLAVVDMISDLSFAKDFGTRVIDLSGTFSFDGMLTLMVSTSSPSVVTASIAGTMLTLTEKGLGESKITVTANDGSNTVTEEFTVTVSRPFVTTWETTTANESITIPTTGDGYNYTVNWGDGMEDTGVTGDATHEYAALGEYTVSITGDFPRIYFNDLMISPIEGNSSKIRTIVAWGNIAWTSMSRAFAGCINLTSTAMDVPDLSGVTDMSIMFAGAEVFNQDINNWNVSMVENMVNMFNTALAFNGDISNWNVSKVENMENMFFQADSFNGDLSNWDVSSVTDMSNMFFDTPAFNGDLSNWDVSSVTDMSSMFFGTSFNGDLSNWDVSLVTNMANMFNSSTTFNGDISNWNVSSVNSMVDMFRRATAFDGNLGNWDVSGVTNFSNFLSSAELSPENYDALLNGWNALTLQSGLTFDAGDSWYTSAGAAARQAIMDDDMWTINDGNQVTEATSFAENGTGTVTDINMMNDVGISYALVAPATGSRRDDDNALFNIDMGTGVLTFKDSPDFESPADANGNNIYAVEVTVTEGGTTKVTVSVSVTNVNEFPPVVVVPGIPDRLLDTGFNTHVIELADTFTDGDGDDLMLTVSTSSPLVVTAAIDPGTTMLTLTEVGGGESVITVTANDGSNTVTEEFTVTVNKPPTATGISDLSLMEGFGTEDIDLSATFMDPDTDALTFSVMSADEGVVTAEIADRTTTLTLTEVGPGGSVITVTATDGRGGMVSDMFTVTVEMVIVEMVTGVAEARSLRAYPNPGSESLTVEMEGTWSLVRIYDFTGRHLHVPVREQGPKKVVLDISGLPGGIYLVKVSGGGHSTVRRLVVEQRF